MEICSLVLKLSRARTVGHTWQSEMVLILELLGSDMPEKYLRPEEQMFQDSCSKPCSVLATISIFFFLRAANTI